MKAYFEFYADKDFQTKLDCIQDIIDLIQRCTYVWGKVTDKKLAMQLHLNHYFKSNENILQGSEVGTQIDRYLININTLLMEDDD